MRRWCVYPLSPCALRLASKFNLSPVTVQVLLNRKVQEDDFLNFLNPSLSSLHSPLLLPDIEIAYQRIKQAVERKEKIFLLGDYDVDGITSLAIFYEYIKTVDVDYFIYIPHRLKEGYGLTQEVVKFAKKQGASLLICFDCGTNAYSQIEFAKSIGIETIVIDHHQPKKGLNFPLAFVNPKVENSKYPFAALSSAGITFKLVQLLKDESCCELLDLVALSVVCDIVPLQGENRILVKEGLSQLRKGNRPSIKILCEISGVKQESLDIYHIGYILGPRINASGRVAQARDSLDVFLTTDIDFIRNKVERLQEYNNLRREVEAFILKEAEVKLGRYLLEQDYTIVLSGEEWHPGVLGIVASRLVSKYHRPTFLVGFEGERGRGSARSIDNFNLVEALSKCQDYLINFGGHSKAAGIEISRQHIDKFREEINKIARDTLSAVDLVPVIKVDLELKFEEISLKLLEELERLKPFGEENPPPLFLTRNLSVRQPPKKINGGKFSLWLTDNKFTYEGIFYEQDGLLDVFNYGRKVDVVYTLERNRYYNAPRLSIKDSKLA